MRARTFIAPVSFGLGDLVVSLPVVQALVRTDEVLSISLADGIVHLD